LTKQVAEFVLNELQAKQRDRSATFSASARGTCPRQQVLAYEGFPGQNNFTSDTNAIFIHGTWTHVKWQAMGLEAGWLATTEVSCRIDEYNATGTIDGRLYEGSGWEFKSINSRGYRSVHESGPLWKHLLQVHTYMLATGIRVWSLMYEDKDTQQWTEFIVPWSDEIGDQVHAELQMVNRAVSDRVLPPVLPDCAKGEGTTYKQCPYRSNCPSLSRYPKRLRISRG
jgi:hypothetical protein